MLFSHLITHCVIMYITEPPVVLPDNPLEVLSEEYREIVEKLVLYQDKYELPSEDDVARLAVSCLFSPPVHMHCFLSVCLYDGSDLKWEKIFHISKSIVPRDLKFGTHIKDYCIISNMRSRSNNKIACLHSQ